MQQESGSNREVLPEVKPPPWTIRGDMYWLVLRMKTLPLGIYDPLEDAHLSSEANDFRGGFGLVMIIRYTDTPCGPYDELLVIPGAFKVPGGERKGKADLRISRIYVNQRDTTYNGRIPNGMGGSHGLTMLQVGGTGISQSIWHASNGRRPLEKKENSARS